MIEAIWLLASMALLCLGTSPLAFFMCCCEDPCAVVADEDLEDWTPELIIGGISDDLCTEGRCVNWNDTYLLTFLNGSTGTGTALKRWRVDFSIPNPCGLGNPIDVSILIVLSCSPGAHYIEILIQWVGGWSRTYRYTSVDPIDVTTLGPLTESDFSQTAESGSSCDSTGITIDLQWLSP